MVYAVDLAGLRSIVAGGHRDRASELPDGSSARLLTEGRSVADPVEAGHAVEALCRLLGRELPNGSVAPVPIDYLDAGDRSLADAGIHEDVRFGNLAFRGAPVAGIPRADDYPTIGFIEETSLAAEANRLGRVSADEPAVDDMLRELEDWAELAVATGRGLVGFMY